MALVREKQRFVRYAFSVQYNGSPFLGFTYQGPKGENCRVVQQKNEKDKNNAGAGAGTGAGSVVDLRGWYSVEGRIRLAFNSLVNSNKRETIEMNKEKEDQDDKKVVLHNHDDDKVDESNYENFQVSSRTDRGVHAWRNTFHVDIRTKQHSNEGQWETHKLLKGLNYFLKRDHLLLQRQQQEDDHDDHMSYKQERWRHTSQFHKQQPPILTGNEIRITSCKAAPLELIPNKFFNPNASFDADADGGTIDNNDFESRFQSKLQLQPSHISWNARFTAKRRTYVYRILTHSMPAIDTSSNSHLNVLEQPEIMQEFGIPFEDMWSWNIFHNYTSSSSSSSTTTTTNFENNALNISNMRKAATFLVGRNDYSSFRGSRCSRSSPIVTIENIDIQSVPILPVTLGVYSSSNNNTNNSNNSQYVNAHIVSIIIRGDAFLYRQVRNMVGCLVDVGKEKISPEDVQHILQARDRSKAGVMAPAHGLYLANVEHHHLAF